MDLVVFDNKPMVELVAVDRTSLQVVIVGVVFTLKLVVVEEAMKLELVSREGQVVLKSVPEVDIDIDVEAGTVRVTVSYTVWVSVGPTVSTLKL